MQHKRLHAGWQDVLQEVYFTVVLLDCFDTVAPHSRALQGTLS